MEGHCLMCGNLRALVGGICEQCRADMLAKRRVERKRQPLESLTLQAVRNHGHDVGGQMGAAFERAAVTAQVEGSRYGWD